MFTNSDKVHMSNYRKQCLWIYPNQVGCDIFSHTVGMLIHCATQEKLAQYFSRQVSLMCLFGCHFHTLGETIALRPFVVNKWQLLQNIASLSHECSTWHQNHDVMESIGAKLFPPRGRSSVAYGVMGTCQSVIGWLCFGKFKVKFIPMNDVGC